MTSLELPLAGGACAPAGFLLYARPPRARAYGFADPERVKCQQTSKRRRQCRRYAVEMVDGRPVCRVHGIIARGGRIGARRAQQAELRLRPRRKRKEKAMANPHELQKCSCDHPWPEHEGSGGPCAHTEPATTEGGEPQRCECPKWDGQPFEAPAEFSAEELAEAERMIEEEQRRSGGGDPPED